ncbi:hypothetical protein [Kitasatospora cheerisanensis]|uniref:Uncharacterized protein n=1 Tax=Kitasatospora cheerisanensis KCTC 2395 TaxID=1348663 RepID=A0A066ZBK6_9ACTN|nr:hypothetical protein [Kitasatospora cheerisanensis]KDN87666.1 hypothetical protein KCH_05870 [Kitasatospora cheerisanensis KCTC 2395]
MTVVLCLGVLVGYALVAFLTARSVFLRGRAAYLEGRTGSGGAHTVGAFERQERQQTEAVALCAGALWPAAVPLLLLRRAVAALVLARPAGPVRPAPGEVAERIEELERALRLGRHAAPPCSGPARMPARDGGRRTDEVPTTRRKS